MHILYTPVCFYMYDREGGTLWREQQRSLVDIFERADYSL